MTSDNLALVPRTSLKLSPCEDIGI